MVKFGIWGRVLACLLPLLPKIWTMDTTICGIFQEKGGKMADFKSKVQDIGELLTKLDKNEKKIILKFIIMNDLKLYTEVLFEEQRRLEKECGIKGVESYEECNFDDINSDDKSSRSHELEQKDGFLGYCGGEKT